MTDNTPQHSIDYLELAVDSIAVAKAFTGKPSTGRFRITARITANSATAD